MPLSGIWIKYSVMFDVEKVRRDFPILGVRVYDKPLVYLDSGATAQKPECVIETVDRLHRESNANIHRGVHFLSEEATEMYEAARARIAEYIGAEAREEVVFTAGATASLNTVAYAWCERFLRAGDNIVVSEMEHHSNIVPWQLVAERKGAEIRVLPFDEEGRLMTERLPALLDARTRVVAVTQASNTLGTRPDLRPVIDEAHRVGAVVVVDGCQGVVHGGVDVKALDCDFYAFSGHKLYAPTGIGVLYGKRDLLDRMPPFLSGGDMIESVTRTGAVYAELPHKFEAGTVNAAGAAGLAAAIRYVQSVGFDTIRQREHDLTANALARVLAVPHVHVLGTDKPEDHNGIITFTVDGVHPHDISEIMASDGVNIRAGHHCAQPLLAHLGLNATARASFAFYNTDEDVDRFIESLSTLRERMGYGK